LTLSLKLKKSKLIKNSLTNKKQSALQDKRRFKLRNKSLKKKQRKLKALNSRLNS